MSKTAKVVLSWSWQAKASQVYGSFCSSRLCRHTRFHRSYSEVLPAQQGFLWHSSNASRVLQTVLCDPARFTRQLEDHEVLADLG